MHRVQRTARTHHAFAACVGCRSMTPWGSEHQRRLCPAAAAGSKARRHQRTRAQRIRNRCSFGFQGVAAVLASDACTALAHAARNRQRQACHGHWCSKHASTSGSEVRTPCSRTQAQKIHAARAATDQSRRGGGMVGRMRVVRAPSQLPTQTMATKRNAARTLLHQPPPQAQKRQTRTCAEPNKARAAGHTPDLRKATT